MYSKIIVARNYFPASWCDEINNFTLNNIEPSSDMGKYGARKCTVRLIDQQQAIFHSVFKNMSVFVERNLDRLKVDIDHKIAGNSIQHITYDPGDHVKWHNDTATVTAANNFSTNRKLSITIVLSDPSEYTGGEFVFDPEVKIPTKVEGKGTVALFTSHSQHMVSEVTSGRRNILFAFFTGPEWR